MTSGGYSSAFQTTLPEVFSAAPKGKGKRTVFLVAEQTDIPPIALALQEAGEAFLVTQGKTGTALGGGRRAVPLTKDMEVQIRTTELIGRSKRHLVALAPADWVRATAGGLTFQFSGAGPRPMRSWSILPLSSS
jgi:hypothetical protein